MGNAIQKVVVKESGGPEVLSLAVAASPKIGTGEQIVALGGGKLSFDARRGSTATTAAAARF